MHDYPPLVSGALHLLFRHFSQRQEVLMAFKQVNLYAFLTVSSKLQIGEVFRWYKLPFCIHIRSNCWWQVRMWTTTSRSSQTWTSYALLWRSLNCGFTKDKEKMGWMQMELPNLTIKRRYLEIRRPHIGKLHLAKDCWSTFSKKSIFILFLTGRLSSIRQVRRNQQLQLQGCERGLLIWILKKCFQV